MKAFSLQSLFIVMHIEIYCILVEIIRTGQEKTVVLTLETGETEKDFEKLLANFKSGLAEELCFEPHRILTCRRVAKIFPKEW